MKNRTIPASALVLAFTLAGCQGPAPAAKAQDIPAGAAGAELVLDNVP